MTVGLERARQRHDEDQQDALLRVEGVTLRYATDAAVITAAWRVSFDCAQGERLVLLGPSGCGKSTLLKSVAGFIKPSEGSIRIGSKVVEGPGPDRVMVFQEFDQLLPWKTVERNIVFPLRKTNVSRAEAASRARTYMEKVGLTKFANSYPHQLSGGMKQRVAIARALAMGPKVLLMDEPFASLDALTRSKMQGELLRLWEDTRFTLLFVTHSIEEALLIGSRVVVLSPHPGQVRAVITSDRHGVSLAAMAHAESLRRDISQLVLSEPREREAVE